MLRVNFLNIPQRKDYLIYHKDTISGKIFQCVCKFGWEGGLCQEHLGIRVAAFTGQSYLSHRLSNSNGTHVALVARTMAPTGILLYAHLTSDIYMYLYLEDGLLKFQFSCGIQTMLFSEVQLRVNNGFDLTVLVT